MKRLGVAVTVLIAACGSGVTGPTTAQPVNPSTTQTSSTTTTASMETTTTVVDRCAEATAESIDAFDIMLDRIDADLEAFAADSTTLEELSRELGSLMGSECGLDGSGEALSELLVFFADEATVRPAPTRVVIGGILEGICTDPPVELTMRGRAACSANS